MMLTSEDQDEHDKACKGIIPADDYIAKELVAAKEELANTNLRLNRANQFTEQIRNELVVDDVMLKANNAEQSLEKMTDDLLH